MGSKESGRRPKYNAEVHALIIKHLTLGATKAHAAAIAKIAPATLDNWVTRGNAGEEPYEQFAIDVEGAIAVDIVRNLAIITKAATGPVKGDWKAAAWLLERKAPQLYSLRIAELAYLKEHGVREHGEPVRSPWGGRVATKMPAEPKRPVRYDA